MQEKCGTYYYRVQLSNESITEPLIPQAGYTKVNTEFFSLYLPESWQERKYRDIVLYFDDIDRNSISVTYETAKNFDNVPKFNAIQNFNVTSARMISYIGQPMLIVEKQEGGSYIYSYLFNAGDSAAHIILTFTSAEADCHEEIFHSLQISDE